MFKQSVTTCTVCLILTAAILTHSLGAPDPEDIGVQEPKSMFDVVVQKCPNLEASNFKENEIFTKKCVNWAEINATSSFNVTTKSNVQCLVFYEGLVSFCTHIGNTLTKVQGLIPTVSELNKDSSNNIQKVCNSGPLYPPNYTEHNISRLIPNNEDCLLLCLDYYFGHVADICSYAYYFTNFNTSKFNDYFKSKVVNHTNPPVLKPAQEPVKNTVSNTTQLIQNETKGAPDTSPKKVISVAVPSKPQHPENVTQKAEAPKSEQPEPVEAVKEQSMTESKLPKPPLQGPTVQAIPPVKPPGIESVAANPESKKSPQAAPVDNKDLEIKDDQLQDQDAYSGEEKFPGGGPDQEIDGDNDPAQVEKDEHVMPEEESEPKVTPKKVKPSIVGDEPATNLITTEDDMDGDSYFFSYFAVIMCLFIVGYVGYHNRQKILALILEGKKGRRPGRGRRPNSANYHKLDTNLEEAISSSCTKSATNVIY